MSRVKPRKAPKHPSRNGATDAPLDAEEDTSVAEESAAEQSAVDDSSGDDVAETNGHAGKPELQRADQASRHGRIDGGQPA